MNDGRPRVKSPRVRRSSAATVRPSVNVDDSPAMTKTPPSPFQGLWIPIVTPFRDGLVDHDALAALTRQLAPTGLGGIVVCGTTGEAPALDEGEQLACLRTVARHAGTVPLMMGLGGYHLGEARAGA